MYNLYLDDLREPPIDGIQYEIARDVEQAKKLVRVKGLPKFMSLDHDLGGDETAMQFLRWLSENYYNEGPPPYQVHSANPIGAQNIVSLLNSWSKSLGRSCLYYDQVDRPTKG